MSKTLFKGTPCSTIGDLPEIGDKAVEFSLVGKGLGEVKLSEFLGKKVVLNIFPSVDTGTCAASVRYFNQEAAAFRNTVVICISKDLPFAQGRFCGAEGIENVIMASEYKGSSFASDYGVELEDSPLQGLFARAVIVLDEEGYVVYTELVPEITQEPDYNSAKNALV